MFSIKEPIFDVEYWLTELVRELITTSESHKTKLQ